MTNKNFSTRGTFGDTIFSLCLVKMLGGGDLYVKLDALDDLWKNIIGGQNAGPASGRYTQQDYEFIRPLLEAQDYINQVAVWNGETDCEDFIDHWKMHMIKGWQGNQTESYALTVGMNIHAPAIRNKLLFEPWLTPVDPIIIPGKPIAVHRAHRYNYTQNPSVEWNDFIHQGLDERGFFLGTKTEHAAFEQQFKIKIYHQEVPNLLEMARYLQGCEMFIGNQSVHASIAIGLGKTYWIELRKDWEHTMTPHGGYGDTWFPRINGFYF